MNIEDKLISSTDEAEKQSAKPSKIDNNPVARQLAKEEKVKIKIALTEKERDLLAAKKELEPIMVTINGYRFTYPKGATIEVPKSVAYVLEKSQKI